MPLACGVALSQELKPCEDEKIPVISSLPACPAQRSHIPEVTRLSGLEG